MKPILPLLALATLLLSSCASAYKTGQTPDDVYYSPARPQDEYVQVEKKDDRRYTSDEEYYEDRYLRMRMQDRYRWSVLDDYYLNSPYAYNYSFYGGNWRSPYNSYWCWNNYYNPYYYSGYHYYPLPVIVTNPKAYTPPPSRPIAFNINSYNPGSVKPNASGNKFSSYYNTNNSNGSNNGSRYNNRNSSSFGNTLKKVFSNSNNNSSSYSGSNSTSTPSRSYNPSSSSSSSSSSRSSSSSSSSSSSGGGGRPGR